MRLLIANITCLTIAVTSLFSSAAYAQTVSQCDAMKSDIYHRVNPVSQANLLTPWKSESDNAAVKYGFTTDKGTPFKAGLNAAQGLVGIHRLHNPKSNDFVWIKAGSEVTNAVAKYGYQDSGVNFYASSTAQTCTTPVHRYLKGNKHRQVVAQAEREKLLAEGWIYEGVSFHAATASLPPAETKFTIAVIPDTQTEAQASIDRVTRDSSDKRFLNRMQWLVGQRQNLNLKFVLQVGDLTNWGERDEHQYKVVSEGSKPIEDAGIPFSYAIGNHDTKAVGCPGGGACENDPEGTVPQLARKTPLFNQYFSKRFVNMKGQYEANKVDNQYSTFEAGGVKWLVLSLELWARQGAIDWAKTIVESHPKHNVIVVTHAYLNGDGTIQQNNGGYGSTSPQHLFNSLIKVYPNIKMVFSGHVGQANWRTDTGTNGNKILSFVQNGFPNQTIDGVSKRVNATRIVEIDTAANSVETYFYSPITNTSYEKFDTSADKMSFIR